MNFEDEIKWASPPSETVLRIIYQKKININLFREKIGLSVEEFTDLLHEKLDIYPKLLSDFSNLLGGSQNFWFNRYQEYAKDVKNVNKEFLETNFEFLNKLSTERSTKVDELLNNFKISNYEKLISEYVDSTEIMFSKSQQISPSPEKLASWIRDCEIIAEKVVISKSINIFDSEKLEISLEKILPLTRVNSVDRVLNKLKEILLSSGVVLLFSSSVIGNGVSGFTKPILKKYRLIVVTDRYKNNATFWFTLLHEIAHCILHANDKTLIHYCDEEFNLASLPSNNYYEEEQANFFVENLLFPVEFLNNLKVVSKSYKDIINLAVKYNIASALVVAQMHRLNLAPYSFFRKVYKKVEFKGIY